MRGFLKTFALIILACIAIGIVSVVIILSAAMKTLPDHNKLAEYEPAVSSKIFAADGQQIGLFARENRIYTPIERIPNHVIAAYMAAEDKDFYTHNGVDPMGVARAIVVNVLRSGSGQRMQGASTITQQVAQNVLMESQAKEHGFAKFVSKAKEVLASLRIEEILDKDQIMEIYLNQIFLGFRSYGVGAAAQTYFGRDIKDVTVAQAAYLASLPKSPINYNLVTHKDRALERRNWVIGRMFENGFITRQQMDEAMHETIDYQPKPQGSWTNPEAGEFVEEVRRDLIRRFGKDAPYSKGFIISTTVDVEAQKMAREALKAGLDAVNPNRQRGFKGAVGMITADENWHAKIANAKFWRPNPKSVLAVVLGNGTMYGLQNGKTTSIPQADQDWAARSAKPLSDGQIVWVATNDQKTYQLLRSENIQGALVSINAHNGNVIAMAGGYDIEDSGFNRATQARRQPGSSFKPIIYAAALEQGMTPETKISDTKISGGGWGPENSDRKYFGVMTLRNALVLSRNTVTVRIARRIGMRRVADYARRFGVYDDLPNDLTMALGAGETTVLRLTGGFTVFPNSGRFIQPVLFNRLQNSRGQTVWRADRRTCSGCESDFDPALPPPHIEPFGKQVISPRTAWEMEGILRDVVTKGTGKAAQFSHPVGGKTGTTNDYKDAWFVGFTPSYATGVFVGYDTPRTIYSGAAGGKVSAPIFRRFMTQFMASKPNEEFKPSQEVINEIDSQERLNIIAALQRDPNDKKALSSLSSGKAFTETSANANDDEVIDDFGPKKHKKN